MWGPGKGRSLGALVSASKGQDTGLLTVLLGLALFAVLIVDGTPLQSAELAAAVLSSVLEVLEVLEMFVALPELAEFEIRTVPDLAEILPNKLFLVGAPGVLWGFGVGAAPGLPVLWLSWALWLLDLEAPGLVVNSGLAYFGRILGGRF